MSRDQWVNFGIGLLLLAWLAVVVGFVAVANYLWDHRERR